MSEIHLSQSSLVDQLTGLSYEEQIITLEKSGFCEGEGNEGNLENGYSVFELSGRIGKVMMIPGKGAISFRGEYIIDEVVCILSDDGNRNKLAYMIKKNGMYALYTPDIEGNLETQGNQIMNLLHPSGSFESEDVCLNEGLVSYLSSQGQNID